LLNCNSYDYRAEKITPPTAETEKEIKALYDAIKLHKKLSFHIFRMAMVGFYNIKHSKKSDKIILIDFSKPSTQKRCFVIDLIHKKLLYQCLVAHGKNSGGNTPSKFSNIPESKQSSLGFFLTAEVYNGKHGLSLRLDGIEKDINHYARQRAIVIHGANYVSPDFVKKNGRLGRSWGCPALPMPLSKEIIPLIANGRCMFIYAKDANYLENSNYSLTG